MMLKRVIRIVFLFLCAFTSFSVQAQNSRSAEIAQQKAEKAKNLRPYKMGRAEEIVISLTGPRNGFYPVVGSAFSGGGFSLGPGYFKMLGENMATISRTLVN
jgi:hypothetical protein